jgi:hypothetical protein
MSLFFVSPSYHDLFISSICVLAKNLKGSFQHDLSILASSVCLDHNRFLPGSPLWAVVSGIVHFKDVFLFPLNFSII